MSTMSAIASWTLFIHLSKQCVQILYPKYSLLSTSHQVMHQVLFNQHLLFDNTASDEVQNQSKRSTPEGNQQTVPRGHLPFQAIQIDPATAYQVPSNEVYPVLCCIAWP